MSGTGGDADGDAGILLSPACTEHYDYIGGGKPPPTTVSPERHAGALESAKQEESCHHTVRQVGIEEALTDDVGGYAGECGEVFPVLWRAA